MRYHFTKPEIYISIYGKRYICDHPVYNSCTLYEMDGKGLAVIQQRYDLDTKSTWWSEVDPWITDSLYLHPDFREYFGKRSGPCTDGLYEEVAYAKETGKMALYIYRNALHSDFKIVRTPEYCSDRLYGYVACATLKD